MHQINSDEEFQWYINSDTLEYKSEQQWLPSMQTSEDAIIAVRSKVKEIVDSNRQGVHDYVRIHYSDYQYLLCQPFRESFQKVEYDTLTWQQTKTVHQYSTII